jgi:hypothetical protein
VAGILSGAPLWGAGPAEKEGSAPSAPAAPAAPTAPDVKPDVKPDAADRSLREQDIYIPYEKLRQVFEKHGRGVFLPYEEFDALWQAAQDKTRPAAEPRPPVGAVITEIENEAVVSGDVVQIKAKLTIDLLSEGWHEIPLRLADAAIVRATLHGEPARILGGANADHRLLIEKKGKQPESVELLLEYAKAITRSPGSNSVSVETPQAPVSRWRVRIPQAGVKVNLQPLIAATEVPTAKPQAAAKPEAGVKPQAAADETVILAFVGAAPTVRIEWTPKAEGATGLSALASVQAEQQVQIQEGVVHVHSNLAYSISRAELGQLAIEVPADYKVVNVSDPNVRQWSVEASGAGPTAAQRITAQLFEPAKTSQQVTVELEKIAGKKQADKLMVPVIRALGVGRQQGLVMVQVGSGLRAEAVRSSGVLQVDAPELSGRPGGWAFVYRYFAVPFELELSIEEVQPRITVDSLVEARLEPKALTMDLTAIYTIERAGVFKLELDRPAGFEVRQVRGRDIPGDDAHRAAAVEVQSHHLEGEKQDRLVVNLARQATGRVALSVQFHRDLDEPSLLAPPGKADIPLPLPQVPAKTVERAAGRLLIYAPESLRVNASKAEGLRAVSLQEALEGMPWAAAANGDPFGERFGGLRPLLPFTFAQEPVVLRLAAERKEPVVTIRQLLVGHIKEGRIEYQATFYYTILYSGLKSLRIDLPADVAAAMHATTAGIQDKRLDPQPADVAKDMVAWSFNGENELLGEGQIALAWEKKIDKLEVGKGIEVGVRPLVPRGANVAWGQIVLTRAETLDVHEIGEPQGLQPIDPQHDLMTAVAGGVRAFQFQGDSWTLPLSITRYKLEEVKRTSIDRAVVRMVLTPADKITAVQALYRIRSAQQRLAIRLPDGHKFDADPLRINSQPVALEQGPEAGQYFVPLPTANADEPLLLELRYTVPRGSGLELPAFLDDPAVQEVYLCAFVPATQALLGASGPWTEKFQWRFPRKQGLWGKRLPVNQIDDKALVAYVREGVKDAGAAADSFHTDGTQYVFSTMGPGDPLVIRTLDSRALSGLVFAVVLLGGLALVPARCGHRVLAVGGLIALVVLAGVFLPTLSVQVFNGNFAAAVFLVLVLWAVVCVFRLSPAAAQCWRSWRSAPPAPPPAPPEWLSSTESATPPPPAEPPAPETPSEGGPSNA